MSDSLRPHQMQHSIQAFLSSSSLGACSNSCPLSRECHPIISPSVIPFSFCLSSFQTSGSFLMSQFFASGRPRMRVSVSVLPMNIQDWFPLGLTGWISLQSEGTLKILLQHCSSKASVFKRSSFFMIQLSHPYITTGLYRPLLAK